MLELEQLQQEVAELRQRVEALTERAEILEIQQAEVGLAFLDPIKRAIERSGRTRSPAEVLSEIGNQAISVIEDLRGIVEQATRTEKEPTAGKAAGEEPKLSYLVLEVARRSMVAYAELAGGDDYQPERKALIKLAEMAQTLIACGRGLRNGGL